MTAKASPMDFDKMPAGHEMDALVAEKVMGLKVVEDPVSHRGLAIGRADTFGSDLPYYSINIADAWRTLEKFAVEMMVFKVGSNRDADERIFYDCLIGFGDHGWPAVVKGSAVGDTAPLAICRAALKAVSE